MSSIIEERLAQRVKEEQEAAAKAAQEPQPTEEQTVAQVVGDMNAAEAAKQQQQPPQVQVPLVQKQLTIVFTFKPEVGLEPMSEDLPVNVPELPNGEGEARAAMQIYQSFLQIGAVLIRKESSFTFHPMNLFKGIEFKFGDVVIARTGPALATVKD